MLNKLPNPNELFTLTLSLILFSYDAAVFGDSLAKPENLCAVSDR